MMPHSIGFNNDPRQAARDSGPILFAKPVEYGTAKQTTVLADSVRASGTHTLKRNQARRDDSRLASLQPARFNQRFSIICGPILIDAWLIGLCRPACILSVQSV
jgi:hypothetical protein